MPLDLQCMNGCGKGNPMTFASYYREAFRDDIQRFMASIPENSKHHSSDKTEFTIQYYRLTKDSTHLDVIKPEHRAHFAVALFFTVLIDEVFYTYYKDQYKAFRALTYYPKVIGDCLGACHLHYHPQDILNAINHSYGGKNATRREDVSFADSFTEAVHVIREEIDDFFARHMKEIDSADFWERCKHEVPWNWKRLKNSRLAELE